MLLAASPHSKENPEIYDALSSTPAEPLVSSPAPVSAQTAGENVTITPSTPHEKAPAHPFHTPQQLAQLEAIARAKSQEKLGLTLVPNEEKYLAAQLVYLASQHHGSEYNRQKIGNLQGGQTVYIPLSIQLPTHISELRMRQAQSSRRHAWFIAAPKGMSDGPIQFGLLQNGLEEQINGQPLHFGRSSDQAHQTQGKVGTNESTHLARPTFRHSERTSCLQLEPVEIELLHDALGNSLFPTNRYPETPVSAVEPKTTRPLLSIHPPSHLTTSALDSDGVATPPPLPETTLPQFPSPARLRTLSQNAVVRSTRLPNDLICSHSGQWNPVLDNFKGSSVATKSGSLFVPGERPALWPPPSACPTPAYVGPAPSLELQMALEAAIAEDAMPGVNQSSTAGAIEHQSIGITQHSTSVAHPHGSGIGRLPMLMPPGFIAPKTSKTHPINISRIIPPEYLAAISAQLQEYPPNNDEVRREGEHMRGSYFRVTPSFRLDRIIYMLTCRAALEARDPMARHSPATARVKFAGGTTGAGSALLVGGPGVRPSTSEPNFGRSLKRPLAMTSPTPFSPISGVKRVAPPTNKPQNCNDHPPDVSNLDVQVIHGTLLHGWSTGDHPGQKIFGFSGGVMAETNGHSTQTDSPTAGVTEQQHECHPPTPITLPTLPPFFSGSSSAPPFVTPQHTPMVSLGLHPRASFPATAVPIPSKNGFVLGNLYLSSCPGKKVRLDGPAKGRGTICRDVGTDLARVKSAGVHLVICCLDNDEMEFLGVPWSEYQEAATSIGLDVLRLPMPEGLCPLSVQAMSQHLDQIITNYTLKGRHVLAHCRGGVGRAGLVACTWMLKLGLCGSAEPSLNTTIQDPSIQLPATSLMQNSRVASDSLELLERVVYILRRQRSMKAIETYEQVRFLLEFIEYLRHTNAKALGVRA